jgi:hypothetical protein
MPRQPPDNFGTDDVDNPAISTSDTSNDRGEREGRSSSASSSGVGPLSMGVSAWQSGDPSVLSSRVRCPAPRLELVAGVFGVGHAADVAASADRQSREHERALVAAELRASALQALHLRLRSPTSFVNLARGLGSCDLRNPTPGLPSGRVGIDPTLKIDRHVGRDTRNDSPFCILV